MRTPTGERFQMMSLPRCPACGHGFNAPEINFDGALGKRKANPCPTCSTMLTWDARWFAVFRTGCWMLIFSILCMATLLFEVRSPALGIAMAVGLFGGLVLFVIGAIATNLAVDDARQRTAAESGIVPDRLEL